MLTNFGTLPIERIHNMLKVEHAYIYSMRIYIAWVYIAWCIAWYT